MPMTSQQPKEPYLDIRARTPDEPGKFVLVLFRPVPFGYGLMTFFVDQMVDELDKEGRMFARSGVMDNGDVIVRFPPGFDFMFVARDQFEFRDPEPESEDEKEPERDPERLGPISHL